MTEKSKTK